VTANGWGPVPALDDVPFDVEVHASVGSTNERARALAAAGAGDVVVLADEQTGGHGRRDRSWASPSGGVWMSVLVRPELRLAEAPVLTLAAGVATVRAVEPVGVEATLKWPNDVLVPTQGGPGDERGERKLAGILTEAAGAGDLVDWIVVGVGVNANVDRDALPPGATSLREEVGDVDRGDLVGRWLEAFDALLADTDAVLDAWREASSTLGRRVRVTTSAGEVVGDAVDVEFPGRLVLDTGDHEVRVHAGDCEHLRPVD